MKIDIVLDVKTILGEGPLWDVEQERLYWIDSFGLRVFRSTADGRELSDAEASPIQRPAALARP